MTCSPEPRQWLWMTEQPHSLTQLAQADPPPAQAEAVTESMPVDVPPVEAQAADTPPVGADPSPEPMPEITTEDMPVPIPAAAPPVEAEAARADTPADLAPSLPALVWQTQPPAACLQQKHKRLLWTSRR